MKQSAMQKLLEEVILEREKSIIVEFREALDFVITAIETDYKEMEKQQRDNFAIEFFLWVKDNEKIIKKGKRITDKQLLETFKNK